jgi:hypothetical protein
VVGATVTVLALAAIRASMQVHARPEEAVQPDRQDVSAAVYDVNLAGRVNRQIISGAKPVLTKSTLRLLPIRSKRSVATRVLERPSAPRMR